MPKYVEEEGKTPVVKGNPPAVRTKSAGKVNRRLDYLAQAYKQANPGMDCRWVWSPANKPDLSNVLERQIDGYRVVTVDQLGDAVADAMPGMKGEDPVRVGDVVLMGIAAEIRQGFHDENIQRAHEELQRVDRQFYEEIEKLNAGLADEHKARPRGTSFTEEVEREVDIDESLKA